MRLVGRELREGSLPFLDGSLRFEPIGVSSCWSREESLEEENQEKGFVTKDLNESTMEEVRLSG